MADEPGDAVVLGTIALSGVFAGTILLDAFRLVVLPAGTVQVLLACLLAPWVVLDVRRGDRIRATGLGLLAGGNLAFLGGAAIALLGSAAMVVGVAVVLAGTIGVFRRVEE